MDEVIPAFEVHATTGMDEEVELVVLGGAVMKGTTKKALSPEKGAPSVAVFDDIQLSPAGSYLFQVQVSAKKDVMARAPRPILIEQSVEKLALTALFDDYTTMLDF